MKCGRCEKRIRRYEHCWWCTGPMCSPCWEDHGECGHPEAEEYQRLAEKARKVGVLMPIVPRSAS